MEVDTIDTSIAFTLGPFTVRWYGIMIVLGIIAAVFVSVYNVKRKNLSIDDLLNIVLLIVPCGIIGARLYYVIFEWGYYSQHLNEIIAIWQGGLAIHGGILGGALAMVLYLRHKKQAFRTWGDIIVPGLILAQGIGRWGNYFNQEAYGYETTVPWAMFIDGAYRHPTFLYESLWDILGFIVLMLLWKAWKNRKTGDILAFYLIFYSCGRFIVESFRTDSLMLGDFRVAMLISLAGVLLGVLCLIFNRKKPALEVAPPQNKPKPKQNNHHPKAKKQKNTKKH